MIEVTDPQHAQQKKNIRYWKDCWNATNPLSELMKEADQAEFWNKRSKDFAKKITTTQSRKRCEENIGFLEASGIRFRGLKVLDIGCGPGTLSLPLARAGAKVTSLDISSGMLERLGEAAEKEGLSIRTLVESWWDADIDKLGLKKKFDLVIGSMTPALKDAETFDRMMACSKKYCFYIGSLPSTRNIAAENLLKNISISQGPRKSPMGMMYPFMYLYLSGYRPEVKITHRKWNETLPWDKAAGHAIDIISHDQAVSDPMKRKIRAFYKKTAIDGKCKFDNEMFLALMIWRVDQ
jgi:SAM-dependent methyltransferase